MILSIFAVVYEFRVRSVVAGILSYIPGLYSWWDNRRPTGNTASSKYSRSIWEIHRDNFIRNTNGERPRDIAELGPGSTLATCIAALCDGANSAIGLDICPYAVSSETNQKMLDELWSGCRDDPRYKSINDAINLLGTQQKNLPLAYFAPWNDSAVLERVSIDLIFSHSVIEHVDYPVNVYSACFGWLKPGGIMSHKIDHSSHRLTRSWNGHYAIPSWVWSLIQGGRPYLLNRITPSQHRALILAQGFEILSEVYIEASDVDKSSPFFFRPQNTDFFIKTSTFVCRKPQ